MIAGYKWTRPDGMSWRDKTFGPYAAGRTLTVPEAVVAFLGTHRGCRGVRFLPGCPLACRK
jgi:hypothetical protein